MGTDVYSSAHRRARDDDKSHEGTIGPSLGDGHPTRAVFPGCGPDGRNPRGRLTPRFSSSSTRAGSFLKRGFDVAIRAIAEARRHGSDMRLEVIGDGPERSTLEDLARRELSDGICAFLGSMDPDLVLARMRLADAVIVPSVWSEPAGFVVLEAMALGVPVVAADAGGIAEVARGSATLVARSDPSAFARALVELANNPASARADGSTRERSRSQHIPRRRWPPGTWGCTAD